LFSLLLQFFIIFFFFCFLFSCVRFSHLCTITSKICNT
jgi:hypothetical protein